MKMQIDRAVYIAKRGQYREIANFLESLFGFKFEEFVSGEGRAEFGGGAIYCSEGLEIGQPRNGVEREGFWGLVIRVPDLEVAKAELAAKGLKPISELVVGKMKEAIYNPEETKGMQLAICEYPASMPSANLATRMK